MRRSLLWPLVVLALGASVSACGKAAQTGLHKSTEAGAEAAPQLTPAAATKNTTRLGGPDAASDAASVASAVYPGLTAATRPQVVVLVDEGNWAASISAAALAAAPLRAPLLYARGGQLPAVSAGALRALAPLGASTLGGAQVIRVATTAPVPAAYRVRDLAAAGGPASAAAAVAELAATAQGHQAHQVIVLSSAAPRALQMPAAGLAAESGAPILFIEDAHVPAPTAAALTSLHHPTIYLLGASRASAGAQAALERYGRVKTIAGGEGEAEAEGDPAANSVAVARFSDGSFGWGIHEAGHGLAFANSARPLDAPGAAPLSAQGDYAPLLLLSDRASVPPVLARYLSNIEPGYTSAVSPVREVYNHGWLIGDESAIAARVQAEIDAVLEVAPRAPSAAEPPAAPE